MTEDREIWRDLPEWNVRISNHKRVQSISTGLIQKGYRVRGRNQIRYSVYNRQKKVGKTVSFVWIARKIAKVEVALYPEWTPEEDAIIKAHPPATAIHLLTGRTSLAIRSRRFEKGWAVKRGPRNAPRMTAEAWRAAAERIIPSHWTRTRDDLIAEMVLLHLDGYDGSPAQALQSIRRRNFDQNLGGRGMSIDAPLSEGGLRLLDILHS